MKTIKPAATLFTDTLDDRTAMIVRRIAGRHDRFATDFIGVGSDDAAAAVAVRLEAWRGEDGLWAIDRFTYAPALDTFRKDVEASPGLCFFDALYHCARFQKTELEGHENRRIIHVEGPQWQSCASYRDAADAANQVIDDHGDAHPCADGRILTTGSFTSKYLETAFRTKGQALLPATQALPAMQAAVSNLLAVNRPADVPAVADRMRHYAESRAQADRAQIHANRLDAVRIAGENLKDCLPALVRQEFRTNIPRISSTLTLGLVPVIGWLRADRRYAPEGHFYKLRERFRNAVKRLPDTPEKAMAAEFARAAESAFLLERAARIMKDDNRFGRHRRESVESAMDCIGRAAEIGNIKPLDIERLKNEYLAGAVDPMIFADKLRAGWTAIEDRIHDVVYELEGGPVLNGGERVGDLLSDGTVYGGVSPFTARKMFIAPVDLPPVKSWQQALDAVAGLKKFHGHDGSAYMDAQQVLKAIKSNKFDRGWRLPAWDELDILHSHKGVGALAGTFNENFGEAAYVTSSPVTVYMGSYDGGRCAVEKVWAFKFHRSSEAKWSEKAESYHKDAPFLVRCVRS